MDASRVEESFPLSAIQEGMLFNSLYSPGSGVDVVIGMLDVKEELDEPLFLLDQIALGLVLQQRDQVDRLPGERQVDLRRAALVGHLAKRHQGRSRHRQDKGREVDRRKGLAWARQGRLVVGRLGSFVVRLVRHTLRVARSSPALQRPAALPRWRRAQSPPTCRAA